MFYTSEELLAYAKEEGLADKVKALLYYNKKGYCLEIPKKWEIQKSDNGLVLHLIRANGDEVSMPVTDETLADKTADTLDIYLVSYNGGKTMEVQVFETEPGLDEEEYAQSNLQALLCDFLEHYEINTHGKLKKAIEDAKAERLLALKREKLLKRGRAFGR